MEKTKVTFYTGKVKTDKAGNETRIEKTVLIPKNVKDADYFQVACQFHSLDLIATDLQSKLLKFAFDYEVEDLAVDIVTSELEENHLSDNFTGVHYDEYQKHEDMYNELISLRNNRSDFLHMLERLSDSLMGKSSDLYEEVTCDVYARYFVSSHLNITRENQIVYDKNGNESVKAVYFPMWNEWPSANIDVNALIRWNETQDKKTKDSTFNLFRNVLDSILTKSERYTGKRFDKVGENLLINEFMTGVKKKAKSGKNGGFVKSLMSCQELMIELVIVGFMFMGCTEPLTKDTKSASAITYDSLSNISVGGLAPDEETTK